MCLMSRSEQGTDPATSQRDSCGKGDIRPSVRTRAREKHAQAKTSGVSRTGCAVPENDANGYPAEMQVDIPDAAAAPVQRSGMGSGPPCTLVAAGSAASGGGSAVGASAGAGLGSQGVAERNSFARARAAAKASLRRASHKDPDKDPESLDKALVGRRILGIRAFAQLDSAAVKLQLDGGESTVLFGGGAYDELSRGRSGNVCLCDASGCAKRGFPAAAKGVDNSSSRKGSAVIESVVPCNGLSEEGILEGIPFLSLNFKGRPGRRLYAWYVGPDVPATFVHLLLDPSACTSHMDELPSLAKELPPIP